MADIHTNIDEVLPVIRTKLFDYLSNKISITNPKKAFRCLWHDDTGRPNMTLNPRNDYQTAHCFQCGKTSDIFGFAEKIDSLPTNGHEWLTVTIPTLCKELHIDFNFGEPTAGQKEKLKLYKLCRDIADILDTNKSSSEAISYIQKRGWNSGSHNLIIGSIDEDLLLEKLVENGWSLSTLLQSGIIKTKEKSFFGNDKITFVICDPHNRPIAFISRNIAEDSTEKYIHTFDTLCFQKNRTLFNLGNTINEAKKNGIRIVEGVGDVASLSIDGLHNSVAILGTALSENQLLELKKFGIRKVVLCLDWDKAGQEATQRIIDNIIPKVQDLSYYIKINNKDDSKDPDEFLKRNSKEDFVNLPELSVFEWVIDSFKGEEPEEICIRMLPYIAAEASAVRRNVLVQQLSTRTGIRVEAIENDLSFLRDKSASEKKTSMLAAVQEFQIAISTDPDNYMTLMSGLEETISKIEKKYAKAIVGVNYQLQRFEDMQKLREEDSSERSSATFNFKFYKDFGDALSGGMPYTRGCLIYAGGRSNAGKTMSCIAYGCDVALHDPNAMVIIHSIDDSYEQIEPRIKTNLYNMYEEFNSDFMLTLDMVVSPYKYKDQNHIRNEIKKADEIFKQLLFEEKLILLDSNDGTNLTSLEKQWRYYRTRYPSKKLFGICDNTHDYEDHSNLDRTARMTLISSAQKKLATKYEACLLATAEYRKSDRSYAEKIVYPTNDDLADARALSYRPNIIFHVYNDIADRGEKAEIFWKDKSTGEKRPRLVHLFTKNKINSFKGKLVRDIEPESVMCRPKDLKEAKAEWENADLPANVKKKQEEFDSDLGYSIEAGYDE